MYSSFISTDFLLFFCKGSVKNRKTRNKNIKICKIMLVY